MHRIPTPEMSATKGHSKVPTNYGREGDRLDKERDENNIYSSHGQVDTGLGAKIRFKFLMRFIQIARALNHGLKRSNWDSLNT
jgi:hypothetical protein